MKGSRGFALAVMLTILLALTLGAAVNAEVTPPNLVAWSVSSTAKCGCVDVTLDVESSEPSKVHVEWGSTPALGSQTNDVLIYDATGTLRWSPAPPPGNYFIELVVSNSAGTTRSPLLGLTIDASGGVSTFVPPGPPPAPGGAPSVYSVATVSPPNPAVVVVGDTLNYRVTVWTSPYWPESQPASLSVVLPGNQYVIIPALDPAFDLEGVSTSAGSCEGGLKCDFGLVGPGAEPYVTFSLRAKAVGSYRMVIRSDAGAAVTIPLTVVPRRADLQVQPSTSKLALAIGLRRTIRVLVTNRGPNVVGDATLSVGAPRAVAINASVAGAPCTPTPIKCVLPDLAPGQAVPVTVVTRARRAGRVGIPIGVSSATAQDGNITNNTARLILTTPAGH